MDREIVSRRDVLRGKAHLTAEQKLELELIELKEASPGAGHEAAIRDVVEGLGAGAPGFSLYSYAQLVAMGYTIDEIVDKTISLSASDISNYEAQKDEADYWTRHRRNSMSLYVCAMYAGIMLGHFSVTPVFANEASEFLEGGRPETSFTVMPQGAVETERHCLYVSAVVVRKAFRNGAVATRLIRQGWRLIGNHLESHPLARGYFAEAYSPSGRRLCKAFGMRNVRGDIFARERGERRKPE